MERSTVTAAIPTRGRLIAADKVEGTKVFNAKGESLGTIENLLIDKATGKVAYAILSFGGFLGIGDRHHPLPWGTLRYDTEMGGYVVNLDKQALEKAPSYKTGEIFNFEDEAWGRDIHTYYKIPPYWL